MGDFSILGGFFTWAFLDTEKIRKQRLKCVPQQLSFTVETCTAKKFDSTSDSESTVYQLFTDRGNYSVNCGDYERLCVGDKIAITQVDDVRIGFSLKCWQIEGVEE
ncbi:MAG: hypothetical protein IJO45_04875 [Oscillospiraceae bacterium]|nr:hypothetical protein [Oscillospiraceae bacterium]